MILACTVLIGLKVVTDRQMEGQTPRPSLKRAKYSAIARKNYLHFKYDYFDYFFIKICAISQWRSQDLVVVRALRG